MLTSSGLRQRRASIAVVKETPATVEKRSSTCSNSRLLLSRFVPIEVGGGGSGGWSSRKYSTFTMLAAMVLGLFVGILVGSWYTVAAIGSIKYPRVEKFVMKFSALQGLHFKVDAWGGNDENGEHGEGNGEEEEEEDDEESVISCTKDQPLVEIANSALDAGVFKQMQDCLIGHPMITKNHLNPDGFSGTRGFVIKFANDVGAARFENETQFSCSGFNPLLPFFERARHPKANAFVMNVLVCDKPENTTELVVGTHVDDTLGHTKPNVSHAPFGTGARMESILYWLLNWPIFVICLRLFVNIRLTSSLILFLSCT